jgi:hypothetical protein
MLSRRQRPPRYVVTSFTIEQAQHDWLTNEAMRLTTVTQTRVSMSEIIRAVIAAMMEPKAATDAHTDTQ